MFTAYHCPLPGLIHFRPGKQGSAFGGDETRLPRFDLGPLAAQMVTAGAPAILIPKPPLTLAITHFHSFESPCSPSSSSSGATLLNSRAMLGLVRTALEYLHKQSEVAKSELPPRGRTSWASRILLSMTLPL